MQARSAFKLTIGFIAAVTIWQGFSYATQRPLRIEASHIETEKVYSEGGLIALPETAPAVSPDKIALGRDLFRDVRFSKTNTISCQSCHNLDGYGTDGLSRSVGIGGQLGDANAPSIFNSSLNFRQFWNGRARSLEEQIDGPIHNPKEMGSDWPDVLQKLRADPRLVERFTKIYGHAVTREDATDAIVTFEKSLVTLNSPFDRYLRGDKGALSSYQIDGFKKFQTYGCVACHQGVNVGGNMYQTLGVMGDYFKDRGGEFASDAGRFSVTHLPEDLHMFRVPSLRNVAMTAPYFHDGQVATLDRAVRLMGRYQLGRELSDEDVSDLVQFLNSLTGERPKSLTGQRGVANEKNL